MKNTFMNMVLALGGVTLFCGAGVSLVYSFTEEPRRLAREADLREGIHDVLPQFDRLDSETFRIDGGDVTVHAAQRRGRTVGYAVETFTNRGFSGKITMIVGFTSDAEVHGVKVLEHAETPGFGDAITKADNSMLLSIQGRRLSEMRLAVGRDGGDIDALTGATVTSRAYVDAVSRAYNALMMRTGGIGGTGAETLPAPPDATTGATETETEPEPEPETDAAAGATEVDGTTGATETGGSVPEEQPETD